MEILTTSPIRLWQLWDILPYHIKASVTYLNCESDDDAQDITLEAIPVTNYWHNEDFPNRYWEEFKNYRVVCVSPSITATDKVVDITILKEKEE